MTPAQCLAARALLGWPPDELARRALRATATVRNLEAACHRPHPGTVTALRRALEEAGVEFVAHGDAVTLRPPLACRPRPFAGLAWEGARG